MNDIKAWKAYVQDYYRVAGIPRRVRDRVEIPIRTELGKGKVGGHPMSKPFPVENIHQAMEDLLHRGRFDRSRYSGEP
ncbi:hypothetical protein BXZ70DRAFT_1006154 [Cristinia sonorae]|uniref:Uncharacterized protein n=1 Tax=Cristinia sonorae TaxID=1940300 RepID=A0A8K0USA4_9AGAR|nr:hypothetical protein BXZ70DRAFT_1006154 [Cristinia sonorae]